jgi:hypothetical protein
METSQYPQTPNQLAPKRNTFDINLILKLGGVLAVLFLLFLPVAGCQGTNSANINGIDIIKGKNMDIAIRIFFILSLICGVVLFLFKKPMQLSIMAIAGIVTFLASYFIAKSKAGMDIMEMKVGAYLALLVYAGIAVIGFIKSASQNKQPVIYSSNQQPYYSQQQPPLTQPTVQPPVQAQQNVPRQKFCGKCGAKFPEINPGKFCTKCGEKVLY